jgi:hypothetical protein
VPYEGYDDPDALEDGDDEPSHAAVDTDGVPYEGYDDPDMLEESEGAPSHAAAGVEEAKHGSLPVELVQEMYAWNARFQNALSLPDGDVKNSAIAAVALDFNRLAEKFGQMIIEEYFLSVEKKTIKPTDMGGIAGGAKYVHKGILFKIALGDKEHDTHGIYDGSDEFAAKAAAHEFRGAAAVFMVQNKAGFPKERCLASCLLPLQQLVYGSDDALKTVHADDPNFNASAAAIGDGLGLAPHTV